MQGILHSLKFDPTIFVYQVVLFLALWGIMYVLFWKPMLKHLSDRDQSIVDAYKHVEETKHEMEALRADYQARITQVEAEARAKIQTAIKEAQAERERLVSEARAKTEAAIKQGAAELEREKNQTLLASHSQMIELAMSAIGKALGSAGTPAQLRGVVEDRLSKNLPA